MQRNRFMMLGVLLAGVFVAASDGKPALSQSPIESDQIEVYRAFLSSYTNGSKSPHFNLAKRTSTLDLTDEKAGDCLKDIDLDESAHPESVVHEFDPKIPLRENIIIVDADEQGRVIKKNDPSQAMRRGTPVNQAVGRAFAAGLLTLSEVAFDTTHRYAVMKFSFVCGGKCGHGGTRVFQKRHGQWKEVTRDCGGWVS